MEPSFPTQYSPENTLGSQSDADIWRALRHGAGGLPSAQSSESAVMINAQGVWWAELRRPDGPLVRYGAYVLAGILVALALYFLLRGRVRIDGGRTGRRLPRFSLAQRVVHWSIAALFVLLAVSGLLLLFGRALLIPMLGKSAYGVVATAAMQAHNLFGPIFILSLLAVLVTFIRGNFPARVDLRWFIRGGGLLGGHASARRYNAGEKLWFWTVIIAGFALSGSGVLLSFPDALATRDLLHLSELTHAIGAIMLIGFAMGHIYLGSLGTEGTLEGMTEGTVDENWARTHHDLWLTDIDTKNKAEARWL
ncbi:MAG: formate dehydrogenase subunit gamma [Paracoccaceae bacterium]